MGSFILSVLLHAGVLVFLLITPSRPPIDLTRAAVQISLVTGAPGGENLPSPVLGHRPPAMGRQVLSTEMGPKPGDEPAPSATLPEAAPIPTPEALRQQEPKPEAQSVPEPPKRPDAEPERKPEQPPQPKPQDPVEIPKTPEQAPPKKPEPKPEKKPEPKEPPKKLPEPERKKAETPPQKPKDTPPAKHKSGEEELKDALADLKKQDKSSSASSVSGRRRSSSASGKGGGSSASRALADLEKLVGQTGVGGGGGQGDGPGGGGIYDVYAGLVMEAIQPNWSMPVFSNSNLTVQVRIKLDRNGNVLDCRIERGSGNNVFDASAVNAVQRTKQLPKPPTPAQQDLLINFNSLDMMGGR